MKATWEKIEKNVGVLEVEVDAEQVNSALDKAFKKVVKEVNVPGFRKGKVPRFIFEARFGVESLYRDAINIILPDAYMEAVKQTGIEPVDRPDIDFDEFAKDKPFVFKAKVTVKPEVTLGEYKGIEIPEKSSEVTEEEIAQELERMRNLHAELIVLEEGTAEKGDIAVISYEGFVDGQPFEGNKAERHSLELGSGTFVPGFEDQVIGMAKGEQKDVTITFPENYHAEHLAGKEAVFKVQLLDIKRKKLPDLDDEFAKDVSEFETLEEYKQDIEKTIRERKIKENERAVESAVIEKAAAASEVDIPPVMIETETERMLQEFENRLRLQGMNLELYYRYSGQDEEKLREQLKADAEKRVRNRLVLEAIADAENVTVSEEDVEEELKSLSDIYKQPPEELRKLMEKNGGLEDLKYDLRIRKTVKLLVENSKPVPEVA
mgnify:CR=1 FL=1